MNELIDPKKLTMFELRQKVWAEPSSLNDRPFLVEFLRRQVERARSLTNRELLSGKGGDISGSMCGALAWPDIAAGDEPSWLTEESEPELYRAANLACKLDVEDDQAAWDELFKIVDKL